MRKRETRTRPSPSGDHLVAGQLLVIVTFPSTCFTALRKQANQRAWQ
jgi:hypothetical protein